MGELIRKVKDELQEAEQERLTKSELALFELEAFEMVIRFVVTNIGEVGAQVVGIGSKADVKTKHLQRITLRLTAVPAQQKRVVNSTDRIESRSTPWRDRTTTSWSRPKLMAPFQMAHVWQPPT